MVLRPFRFFELLVSMAIMLGSGLRAQTAIKPAEATVSPAQFSLISQRDPVISLRSVFRFKPGDDEAWARPDFDDSQWALVRANLTWDKIGYRGLSGLAWYRFAVTLPADSQTYALLLPEISTNYQVFADGKLVLTMGEMPPHPRMYRTRVTVVNLPQSTRAVPTPVHIALRVWHDPEWASYFAGGPRGTISMGLAGLLRAQLHLYKDTELWGLSDWFDLAVLDLLAAGVALAIFFLRRSEWEYLWFFLLAAASAGHHFVEAWAYVETSPLRLMEGLENGFFAVYLLASLLFYRQLLNARRSLFLLVAIACCFLWFLNASMLSVVPWFTTGKENAGELVFILPVYLWIMFLIFKRLKQRHPDAGLLVAPVTLLLGTWLLYQVLLTFETLGYEWARRWSLRLWIQHPIYANYLDTAEAIFLLGMLAVLVNRFIRTSRDQDRVASELEAARSVQEVLVPKSIPNFLGLRIAAAYVPAQELGGDFFEVVPLGSGGVLAVIGDVAGKGVPAALTVSLIVGTLSTVAAYTESPGEILSRLNRQLHGRGPGYTTCLVLRIDADRRGLTLANAGHLPLFLNGEEMDCETNLPLGFDPSASYAESRFALQPGDHLTLLTDGVPEAMQERELFGFERTMLLSRESALHIADAARSFGQADDITVLTIDVTSLPKAAVELLPTTLLPA